MTVVDFYVLLLILVGLVIVVAIQSLAAAVILRAAAKWVEKMEVSFGKAYATVLLAGILNNTLGFVVGVAVVVGTGSQRTVLMASIALLPLNLLILSRFVSSRLHIALNRAWLISLTMVGIALVIGLIVAVPSILIWHCSAG